MAEGWIAGRADGETGRFDGWVGMLADSVGSGECYFDSWSRTGPVGDSTVALFVYLLVELVAG